MQDFQPYLELGAEFVTTYSLKIGAALLIFFIGKKLAKWASNLLVALLEKNEVAIELVGFFESQ